MTLKRRRPSQNSSPQFSVPEGERSWLDSRHLARESRGRAALDRFELLDEQHKRRIRARGDFIASHSVTLAHRYFVAAVASAASLAERFADWDDAVAALLGPHGEARALADAMLSLPAERLWQADPESRRAWLESGPLLAERSRRIAATFVETFGQLLCKEHGLDASCIPAWQAATERVLASAGWRGELLASHLLDDAGRLASAMPGDAVALFAELTVRVGSAGRNPRRLALPDGLQNLSGEVQAKLLECCLRFAQRDPLAVEPLLSGLCAAAARLQGATALTLIEIANSCLGESALVEAVKVLPAICHGLDPATTRELLAIGREVADDHPAGACAYLRTMDRALERGGIEGVRAWVERGKTIADKGREAAIAHFALRSRTSRKMLVSHSASVAFEEVQPVLQRFALMVGRRNFHLASGAGVWLRPPILPGDELVVRLPERVDLWPASEDNQLFYKLAVAHAAGRWECGTYSLRLADLRAKGVPLPAGAPDDGDLVTFLESFPNPLLAAGLFVLLDGMRVDACLSREFAGLAEDLSHLGREYVRRLPPVASERSSERLLEALFCVSVGRLGGDDLPPRLRELGDVALRARERLERAESSVVESARLTAALYGMMLLAEAHGGDDDDEGVPVVELGGATFLDEADAPVSTAAAGSGEEQGQATAFERGDDPQPSSIRLQLDEDGLPDSVGGMPLSPEELERLIRQGIELRIGQGLSAEQASLGLFVTDLLGKLPRSAAERLREILSEGDQRGLRAWIAAQRQGRYHNYDEWDYLISDYRHHWCRVAELEFDGDGGRAFHRVLDESTELIAKLKREFLLMRPEQFRRIRGMEDGEEFDLNAVVDARVDMIRRKAPSERLYLARRREERDVATLFLIDMSASTDEPLPDGSRRVIDVTRETLVVMSSVLEEIGDAYAVYGFSGYGRSGVEVYQIKTFQERLGPAVRGRIGAIEPKRSTRMGAALRHALTKFAAVSARARYIILLSDGFPQDFDYGDDRTSNTYGIRDTTKALQEVEANGVHSFCITVDPSGNDYLREMCSSSQYAVIDDLQRLPEELPRIYQSVVGRNG